jgi:hypothetical protein
VGEDHVPILPGNQLLGLSNENNLIIFTMIFSLSNLKLTSRKKIRDASDIRPGYRTCLAGYPAGYRILVLKIAEYPAKLKRYR